MSTKLLINSGIATYVWLHIILYALIVITPLYSTFIDFMLYVESLKDMCRFCGAREDNLTSNFLCYIHTQILNMACIRTYACIYIKGLVTYARGGTTRNV